MGRSLELDVGNSLKKEIGCLGNPALGLYGQGALLLKCLENHRPDEPI